MPASKWGTKALVSVHHHPDAKSRGTRDNAVQLRHVESARVPLRHAAPSPPQLPDSLRKNNDANHPISYFSSHFKPMGLNVAILPVVTEDFSSSSRFTPYEFLSRCKFSTLTTRQTMVEFCLLAFSSRFLLLRKK